MQRLFSWNAKFQFYSEISLCAAAVAVSNSRDCEMCPVCSLHFLPLTMEITASRIRANYVSRKLVISKSFIPKHLNILPSILFIPTKSF